MSELISDDLTAKFLQTAIQALRQEVVPALSTPEARINADLVTRVLYMLHSRFSRRGADLQQLIGDNRELIKDIARLVPGAPQCAPVTTATGSFSAVEALEQELFNEELVLASQMAPLLALVRSNAADKPEALKLLRRIVETQQAFLSAQDPDILKGSQVCYQGGRIEEDRVLAPQSDLLGAEINEASLTQYLQGQFPGAHAEQVSVVAGGFSKTTVFFTLVHANGVREQLVMRKDQPVGKNTSVTFEFPLLRYVHQAGFPVAEPRWLESGNEPFGQPFMVSGRVTGSTDFSRWAGDAQAVEGFARQLARVMVDLHRLPLANLGYPEAVAKQSAGDLMRAEIGRWYETFVSTRPGVHPIQEMALTWLTTNIPESLFARPASMVHGDIGFHNLMIDNGRVTALLDWEFAHPGDPIEDLLYTKPFIDKVMNWETFKSYYYEYGGARCTEEEEFFYAVWSKSRNPVLCTPVAAGFLDSPHSDVKCAVTGFILGRYLELEAGHMIINALDGGSMARP